MSTPTSIDRYDLVEEIGQGGMAVVYRAADTHLHRDVALKLLAAHLETKETVMERFAQEARIIASLDHPHIVTIYDYGTYERRPYLVMRYLRGGTLGSRLVSRPIITTDLWPIAMQIAAALDDAHEHGIIHRDIKPSNLIFDHTGRIHVTDFGVAKMAGNTTRITRRQRILGTPTYMSPEQCAEQEFVSSQSDQYSLAVVLYEALAGRPPFQGDTLALMYQHTHELPKMVHELNDELPIALSDVLSRALSKDPKARYPNVTSFITALQQSSLTDDSDSIISGKPVVLGDGTTYVEPSSPNYEAGNVAMGKGNWRLAISCFNRVGPSDPFYGRALSRKREARQKLMSVRPRPVNPPPSWEKGTSSTKSSSKEKPSKSKKRADTTKAGQPSWAGRLGQFARSALFVILAILGVLVVTILLILIFGGGLSSLGGEPETPEVVPTAVVDKDPTSNNKVVVEDSTPLPAGEETAIAPELTLAVLDAGDDAQWSIAGKIEPVSSGGVIPFPDPEDAPLLIETGSGKMQIEHPNGEHLFLDEQTQVAIESISGSYDAETSSIILNHGRLVVEGVGQPLLITNPFGAQFSTSGSLLGAMIDRQTQEFHTSCLDANECQLKGDLGGQLTLRRGQASEVGGNGIAENVVPARVELFAHLTDLVPTATETVKPTATNTPSRTPTRRPPPVPATVTSVPTIRIVPTVTVFVDTDRDGTPDYLDECPGQFGPGDRKGCPRNKD